MKPERSLRSMRPIMQKPPRGLCRQKTQEQSLLQLLTRNAQDVLELCVAVNKSPVQRYNSQSYTALREGALVVNEVHKKEIQVCSAVLALLNNSKEVVLSM